MIGHEIFISSPLTDVIDVIRSLLAVDRRNRIQESEVRRQKSGTLTVPIKCAPVKQKRQIGLTPVPSAGATPDK